MHHPMVLESTETVSEGPLFKLGMGLMFLQVLMKGLLMGSILCNWRVRWPDVELLW
jgi:hypothetical protein